MRVNLNAVVMAVGLCLLAIGIAMAAERRVTESASVILLVSGVPQEGTFATIELCEAEKARRRAAATSLESGQRRFTCRDDRVTIAYYGPNPAPTTCPPAPASQTRTITCPAGYTGTYTERSTSTVGPLPTCTVTTTWEPIPPGNGACIPVSQPPVPFSFQDRFEYDAGRSSTSVETIFGLRGWTGVKANNSSHLRGGGWVYTQANAALGSRVLVLESNPGPIPMAGMQYSQTDYYLQYGREGSTTQVLPANVWLQFLTYATPESRFSTRDKTIYPCSNFYPCNWGPNLGWLFMWGSGGFNVGGDGSSRRFLAVEAQNADNRGDSEYPTNKAKLRQNVNATPLAGGRWYQVRLHFDTSGAQGTYEAWVRDVGATTWTKVSDWRGGVTPNFFWPIPVDQRRGHTMFRWPTTVNGPGDSTVYVDDFTIASSADALP